MKLMVAVVAVFPLILIRRSVRLPGRHILELGGNNAIIGEEHCRCYSYV